MGNKSYQHRRYNLWSRNPFCHWCGKLTILFEQHKHETVPHNAATLDHLFSRYDARRGLYHHKEVTVLACWECNNKRAKEEQEQIDIDLLRVNSG